VKGGNYVTTTTEDLLKEIKELRAELRQMQTIVNSLVNLVMDIEELDEEGSLVIPDPDNFSMYN
jgi:hypothetical protein